MIVKKYKGKIFGANFTAAEQKAIDIEIKNQLAEWDKKNLHEIDAVILLALHDEFGFGVTRLRQFYNAFSTSIDALIKRYELEDTPEDKIWLAQNRLKDLGIDIEAWQKGELFPFHLQMP